MKSVCTCAMCRRFIRTRIELAFVLEPRWMGEFTIRFEGRLGWVPLRCYRKVLAEMVKLGIIVKSVPDRDDPDGFARYFLARCMVPAQVLAERAKGGVR